MAGTDNETTKGEGEVLAGRKDDLQECRACSTKFRSDELVQLRCATRYCHSCLRKIFETAIKDETMWPPRCCGRRIPTKLARQSLSKPLMSRFKARQRELSTRDRTYCHRAFCSAFIAPHSIHNGQAICQKCRSVTCSKCRNAWHYGPCVEGEDAAFFDLVRTTNWKRCPDCKRIVEKNDGCNHIICRCGNEWCYGCGEGFNACSCRHDTDMSDEDEYDL